MTAPAQLVQHTGSISLIMRLTHHLVVQYHDGIGCDYQFIVGHPFLIDRRFLARDILRNILGGQISRIALVNILYDTNLEININTGQQLLANTTLYEVIIITHY